MRAGGGDFDGAFGVRLAAHLAEVFGVIIEMHQQRFSILQRRTG